MTKPTVLVIDIGTTVVKTSLFDFTCHPIDRVSIPHQTAGLDFAAMADRLWAILKESVPALLQRNTGCRVAAVGLTGFMHTVIPLDKEGSVIPLPAADPGARARFDKMAHELGVDRIFQTTGSRLDVTSVPPQILAWRQHRPKEFAKLACLLPVKDFLRYRLTEELATDPIDACGTMLYDLHQRRWDPELLSYCGLELKTLPPILPCTQRAGAITRTAAGAMGLSEGIPVAVGGGDDIEVIGSGARGPQHVCEHVGSTGSFLMPVLTAQTDPAQRLELYPAAVQAEWVLGGSCSNVSLALDWFLASSAYGRQGDIDWESVHAQFVGSISRVPLNRPYFIPYLNGERAPLWDPDLSAEWIGLRSSHGPSDLLLSVVEGICFSLRNVLEVYKDLGFEVGSVNSSGGFNQLRAQGLRASVYGKPIRLLRGADPTSFATCALALCSIGELRDPWEAAEWLEYEPDVEPVREWQAALDDRFAYFVEFTKRMARYSPQTELASYEDTRTDGKERLTC